VDYLKYLIWTTKIVQIEISFTAQFQFSVKIKKVNSIEDLKKCTEVILALRPHLNAKKVLSMYETMQKEGYHIIYIEEDNKAVAFAGYRSYTMFFSARTIYIDDVCTLPDYRGKGYAGKLLDYIIDKAITGKYNAVSLDSGHHRNKAHKLYLNKEFIIEAHHFHLNIQS
jgi:GNAT superfamily N-acetyltransferase